MFPSILEDTDGSLFSVGILFLLLVHSHSSLDCPASRKSVFLQLLQHAVKFFNLHSVHDSTN